MGTYVVPPQHQLGTERFLDLDEIRLRGKRLDGLRAVLEAASPSYDYYGFAVRTNDADGQGVLIYIPAAPDLADKLEGK